VDGSFSVGDYISDTFEIGGAQIRNLTMGLGIDTDIPYGLAGVGYALNEASVAGDSPASGTYPNLPIAMVQEGLIVTTAYSLWLNDLGKG
jgi:elongation factor G